MINEKRLLDTFLEYVQIDSETKNGEGQWVAAGTGSEGPGFEVQIRPGQERPLAPTASMSQHF